MVKISKCTFFQQKGEQNDSAADKTNVAEPGGIDMASLKSQSAQN